MALVELIFSLDGGQGFVKAGQAAFVTPLVFTNPDTAVEFSELGIGILCIPQSNQGVEFLIRLEVSIEYRGQLYSLDYAGMEGAREFDSLNRNLTNDIVSDVDEFLVRGVNRSFRLSLKGGKSILLTPGETLRFHVKRYLDADAFQGELEIFITGELASGMQVITPRRVRMRRRDLFAN